MNVDPKNIPAVRTDDEDWIEIDQKKGKHPYIHFERGEIEGKEHWVMIADSNEGGAIVGEGQGMSILFIPRKRMKALRDFLNEALEP